MPMNDVQSNVIVDYMANHSALAARKLLGNSGSENRNFQLEKLREEVNKHGPAKSIEQVENVS